MVDGGSGLQWVMVTVGCDVCLWVVVDGSSGLDGCLWVVNDGGSGLLRLMGAVSCLLYLFY